MKNYGRMILFLILGFSLLVSLSCSKDSKPTTPDFEDFSSYQ